MEKQHQDIYVRLQRHLDRQPVGFPATPSGAEIRILKGTPRVFRHQADSGNTLTKEFCPDCGSQLFGTGSGRPGIRNVKVGSMDDASFVRPAINLYASRHLPFVILDPELENYDEMSTS